MPVPTRDPAALIADSSRALRIAQLERSAIDLGLDALALDGADGPAVAVGILERTSRRIEALRAGQPVRS